MLLQVLLVTGGGFGLSAVWAQEKTPATATDAMRIDFNRRVAMRDGVELSADVYRPAGDGKFPVILMRTPYNKMTGGKSAVERMRSWVKHGYVVVQMDCRGRGDSDGKFIPWFDEGPDGYDAIEWCAAQPWSAGKIGTLGGSYLGYNQWAAAVRQPPHLTAMIPLVTPADPFVEDPTGVPSPMEISWYHFVAGHVNQNMDAVDWGPIHKHLPLYTMDEAAGRHVPYWRESIEHARLDDWWEPARYQNKFERVQVPVLNISGWYDDEQVSTPLNYIGVTRHASSEEVRRNQRLLMGPWPHAVNSTRKIGKVDFGADARIDLEGYERQWFDHWLKGADTDLLHQPPVRIFIMGENRWRGENEWPLARTRWTRYYAHSQGHANTLEGDGALSTELPGDEPPDRYRYDPADPTPFLTEPSFAQIGGPDDYRDVERRRDVLVFSTPTLEESIEVTGPIRVRLYAASSAPDTDFTGKLIDVWPDGYAQRLCDGIVRARFREGMDRPALIEPGKVYAYDIDCWNTCQLFQKGHRIRIEISSSAFPKFARTLNTDEPLGKGKRMAVALQTIYHDREHPTHVVLPLIPRKEQAGQRPAPASE
jgi:putative CocE/NonD family hydrolase